MELKLPKLRKEASFKVSTLSLSVFEILAYLPLLKRLELQQLSKKYYNQLIPEIFLQHRFSASMNPEFLPFYQLTPQNEVSITCLKEGQH